MSKPSSEKAMLMSMASSHKNNWQGERRQNEKTKHLLQGNQSSERKW